ncbi:MAG: autotransporter-associated beta strand repeat-containing protein, partial [Chthoniobacter sp.]
MKLPASLKKLLRHRAARFILGTSIVVLASSPLTQGAINRFTHASSGSWSPLGNWSLGTPSSTDALLLSPPTLDSTLDANFAVQSLSFDTASPTLAVDANASGTTARTLTLNGGDFNALGGLDLLATSATTTGTINMGGAAGKGTLTIAFGNANGTINVANSAASLALGANSIVTGSNGITKNGDGTLVLSGANTYTGTTTINAGTLQVASANALNTSGTIRFGGGTLQYASGNNIDYSARLSTAAGQTYRVDTNGQTVAFNTALTANFGTLIKSGAGTLVLATSGSSVDIVLQAGTLNVANAGTFITTGNFTLNGGTLDFGSRTSASLGGLSGAGNLVLTNSSSFGVALTVSSSTILSTTYSGSLSGLGSLTKGGTSTLVLAGDNSAFTGSMTINAGTLRLASANAAAGSMLNLNGGTLSYGDLTAVNIGAASGSAWPTQNEAGLPVAVSVGATGISSGLSGTITGTGTLIKTGSGTLTLQTAGTSTAAITLAAGTLNIGFATNVLGSGIFTINGGTVNFGTLTSANAGALAGSGNLVLTNTSNQAVSFTVGSNSVSTVFSGTLSGLGPFTKTGAGTLTLSGDNSGFTNGMVVNGGTLRLASSNAVAGSTVSGSLSFANLAAVSLGGLAGGTDLPLQNEAGAPVAVSVGGNNQSTTYAGALTGSGTLIKGGTGTLTIGNAGTTAAITVNAGVLATSTPVFSNGVITLNGGSISFGAATSASMGGLAGSGNLALTNTNNLGVNLTVGTNNASTVFSGTLSGLGFLTKTGTGTLTLSGDNSSFTNGISVTGGTLRLANSNAMAGSTVTPAGFSFSNLTTVNFGGLIGGANLITQNEAGIPVTVSVGGNNQSTSYSGALTGSGGLIKVGTGTLTIGNASNTAPITVNAGALAVGAGGLGSGVITVNGGAINFGTFTSSVFGGLAGSGNLVLTNTNSLGVNLTVGTNNASTVFSGTLSGLGFLTKNGTGTLTLSGDNSGFNGSLNATSGLLRLASANAAAGSTVTAANFGFANLTAVNLGGLTGGTALTTQNEAGAPLAISVGGNNQSTAYTGAITGPGSLIKTGTGTLTVGNVSTTVPIFVNAGVLATNSGNFGTGVITLNGGTVSFGTAPNATFGGLAGSGNLVLTNTNSSAVFLSVNGNNSSTTYSGQLSGLGALTKFGAGTLTLSGNNSGFAGDIGIAGGTLALANANAAALSTVAFNSGNLTFSGINAVTLGGLSSVSPATFSTQNDLGGAVNVSVGANNQNTSFQGTVNGPGSFTKIGTGALTFTNSTISVPITLSAGTLIFNGINGISGNLNANGGALTLNSPLTIGGLTGSGSLGLNGTVLTVGSNNTSTIYSGSLSGSGGLAKTGAGTLTLSGDNSNFTGSFVASGGTVLLANPNALAGATISLSSSPLSFGTLTRATFGALINSGLSSLFLQNAAGNPVALTVGANGTSTTFGGAFNGPGSLIKVGAGQFTINNSSNHTGGTIISAGAIQLSGSPFSPLLGTGPLSVGYFGTLSGTGLTSGASTVDGTLAPGNLVGTLGFGSTLNLTGTAHLQIDLTSASNDLINGNGQITLGGNLDITVTGFTPSVGQKFFIIDTVPTATSLNGLFANATPVTATTATIVAGGFQFQINYADSAADGGGNDVSLTYLGTAAGSTPASNTYTWIGGAADPNWSTAGNWQGTTAPISNASTTKLVFSGSPATPSLSPNNSVANFNVFGILFGPGTGNYTLTGQPFNLGSSGLISSRSGLQTIQNNVTLLASQSWSVDAGGTVAVSGNIAGAGFSLTKTGAGTLLLSGTNTYTGGTNINSGTLTVGSGGGLGTSGTISFGGGTLQYSAANTTDYSARFSTAAGQSYNIDANGQNVTLASALTSSGGVLTKSGTGKLTLSGTNTYTGGTNLNGGILSLGSAGALGTTGTISFGGGTLQFTAANTTDYTARFSNTLGQLYSLDTNGQNVTLAGTMNSGAGTLTKIGAGTLILSGNNGYTGGTIINGGILSLNSANAIGTVGSITFGGGTLQYTANNTTDYSARLDQLTSGQTYIIDTNGQTVTFGTALTNAANTLVKIGAGTLRWQNGGSTIPISVNAGALDISADPNLLASATLIVNGGTVAFGNLLSSNVGALAGTTTVILLNGSSQPVTMAAGGNNLSTTFSGSFAGGSGTFNKTGTGVLTLTGDNSGFNGTILVTGGTLRLANINAAAGTLSVSGTLSFGTLTAVNIGNITSFGASSLFLQNENNLPVTLTLGANNQNSNISSPITGSGTLIKVGTGTLAISTTMFSSTAAITLNAGTLDAGGSNTALGSGVFTINGGTLAFGNQNNVSAGGLAGSGTVTLINNFASPVNFTVGSNNFSTIFSGTLAGPGTLIKAGAGTLTLSGNNSSFSGGLSVNAGTLQLASVNAAAGSAVVLNGGALSFGQLTAV